jgi:ornithine cyclodeaminase
VIVIDRDQIDAVLTWPALVDALDAGHRLGRGLTEDLLLEQDGDMLLNRAAWKAGYGLGLKTVSCFFGNPSRTPPRPSVQGLFVLFDHDDGRPLAVIDGAGITAWKTAADSALGSRYLSRPDARCLLMVGAGAMAKALIRAHLSVRPGIKRVLVCNRTPERAEALAAELRAEGLAVEVAADLEAAVGRADIVSTATRTEQPLIRGAWLQPGAHLDLVGAFTATMREADDDVLRRGRLFVDARETTLEHIGELKIPIGRGVIGAADVLADLYDLSAGFAWRRSPDDITVYKNGGGAHLDLMTALAIYRGVAGEPSAASSSRGGP